MEKNLVAFMLMLSVCVQARPFKKGNREEHSGGDFGIAKAFDEVNKQDQDVVDLDLKPVHQRHVASSRFVYRKQASVWAFHPANSLKSSTPKLKAPIVIQRVMTEVSRDEKGRYLHLFERPRKPEEVVKTFDVIGGFYLRFVTSNDVEYIVAMKSPEHLRIVQNMIVNLSDSNLKILLDPSGVADRGFTAYRNGSGTVFPDSFANARLFVQTSDRKIVDVQRLLTHPKIYADSIQQLEYEITEALFMAKKPVAALKKIREVAYLYPTVPWLKNYEDKALDNIRKKQD